jgi:hypothetical protein
MESNDCLLVFFSGENGGYSMCGLIQWRVWIVCSNGEYGLSAQVESTVQIVCSIGDGWSAPVKSMDGLLQRKLVCSSGNYGCLLLWKLWTAASGRLIALSLAPRTPLRPRQGVNHEQTKPDEFTFFNTSDCFSFCRFIFISYGFPYCFLILPNYCQSNSVSASF